MLSDGFYSFLFLHDFKPKALEIISLNLSHNESMLTKLQMTLHLAVCCPNRLSSKVGLASNDYCILKLQITSFFTMFSSFLRHPFAIYLKEPLFQSQLHLIWVFLASQSPPL